MACEVKYLSKIKYSLNEDSDKGGAAWVLMLISRKNKKSS
jgi:hypothetical protein